jgi:hypothetical protein
MSNNTSLAFGAGVLIGTPAGGSPLQFGTLQDVSVDFSFSVKQLMGQFQFPVAAARGAGKISGKAKFANIDGPALNQIFFGNTPTTGQKLWSYNEGAAVPAASPYTATVANAASFDQNLGVAYASSGLQLTQVASSPAQGQYSVAAGVYTFNSADSGKAVLITYSYTQALVGSKAVINNKLMGVAPTFQIDFYQTNPNIAGAQWSLRLYSCISSKLGLASKLEDFSIPEMDFEAFANASNNLGEINTAI